MVGAKIVPHFNVALKMTLNRVSHADTMHAHTYRETVQTDPIGCIYILEMQHGNRPIGAPSPP